MKTYRINGFFAMSEEDKWESGCSGPTTHHDHQFMRPMERTSEEELFRAVCDHFKVEHSAVLLNSCEEVGRVDVQRYESPVGHKASDRLIELWKQGKRRVWLTTYTGYAEVAEPLNFRERTDGQ